MSNDKVGFRALLSIVPTCYNIIVVTSTLALMQCRISGIRIPVALPAWVYLYCLVPARMRQPPMGFMLRTLNGHHPISFSTARPAPLPLRADD
jgi:hypothetical protein